MKERPHSPGADAVLGVVQKVLDHGEVELVDYMGNDEQIARVARVSTGSERQDVGILGFLVRHKHTSPVEFGRLVLRVKLPVFVDRQWFRHRTGRVGGEYEGYATPSREAAFGTLSERSLRYQPPLNVSYVPDPDHCQGKAVAGVKQGRGAAMSGPHAEWVREEVAGQAARALEVYQELAEPDTEHGYPGLAAELARSVLPLGTYTEWYWTIDASNLMHWLLLRLDAHAQREIRAYAEAVYQVFRAWLPVLCRAFDDYVRGAVTLSAKELAALRATGLSASLLQPGDHGMSAGELAEFVAKLERLSAREGSA